MNAVVKTEDRPKREILEVVDPIPVLDTSRFEHMQRIANVMAQSTLIPESLYMEGTGNDKKELPLSQIVANCFLVVNQSVRWGLDPFAVAQSVAVVRGKLCYEGKLVAAVLDAKLGVRLHHHFTGDPTKPEYRVFTADRPFDEDIASQLKPGVSIPGVRLTDGSVADFSTGDKGAWGSIKNYRRMLTYRNSRDWARFFEPAVLLGVYTPDEMIDLEEAARANRARNVTPSILDRLQQRQHSAAGGPAATEGFSVEHVTRETETLTGGAEIEQETSSDAPSSDENGSGDPAPQDAAAGETSSQESGQSEEAGGDNALASEAAGMTDEDHAWLKQTARMLWAATGKGEQELLKGTFDGIREHHTPATIGKAARDKGNSIYKQCKLVCFGEADSADTLELIAGIAGVEPKDLVA